MTFTLVQACGAPYGQGLLDLTHSLDKFILPVNMLAKPFTRRRFLLASLLCVPFLAGADAKLLEPKWLKLRRIRLGASPPRHRIVHFTDVHHKGDRPYFDSVVNQINALSPDFVCFTGDLIEQGHHLPEALQ